MMCKSNVLLDEECWELRNAVQWYSDVSWCKSYIDEYIELWLWYSESSISDRWWNLIRSEYMLHQRELVDATDYFRRLIHRM